MTLLAGRRVAGRYLLERRLAVGGMGEVWEASDTRLGRGVAVKVLRSELSDEPEFLHRFRIEARTVASLDHPGIAAVYDYGEDEPAGTGRTAYLVMELVRGEPLSARIARGPLDPDETLRLLEEAGRALQAAHARGTVHRDVKPGNILVRTDGRVKLTDFGIAKAADAVPVTRTGMVMGTAHYLAPEQACGGEAGPAGDVYSLGVVGYECLAGHRPFRAESTVAVATMQVRDAPPPLPATVPAAVRELIDAVLVKDPALRYRTGGEFADAVAAVRRGGSPPRVRGVPAPDPRPSSGTARAPVATRPAAGPMHLAPAAGPGRGFLLALFVLLTAAALAVGWLLLSGSAGEQETPVSAPSMQRASTVLGREDRVTGSAAADAVTVTTMARRTSETGPPALGWGARHPVQGGRPA